MKAEKNLLFLKTVIVSVACLSATMAGLLYFFLQTSTDIVESNAQQKITELTQAKAKQMDILFQGLIDANEQVANVPFIVKAFQTAEQTGDFPEAQKSQIRGYLGYLMKKYQGLYENLFLDYNRVIAVDGIGGVSEGYGMDEGENANADDLSKYMDPVAQITQTGNSFLGAPQVSPISERLVLMLLTPIKDPASSKVLGIFGAPFDMINMAGSIVSSDNETDNSVISYLVNDQGMVLLSSDEESILNLDFSKTSGTQDFYANLAQQSDGYGFVKVDNVEYIASFSHINHGGLTLINTMPVTQYLAEISSLRQSIIAVMIVATLICAGALTLIFYWITKPLLSRLSQAMHTSEQIAQYDLSHSITISGNDEGTRLLVALNEMQNHLKKTVNNIMQSSSQLKNTSATLSQHATESTTALQTQHNEFEQASSSVSELRQALQSVATSAANAAQASNAGTEHTREGQQSVDKTVKSINSLADRLKTTSSSVEDLASQINNIGTVLDVIRSVAEQTNLLALNAAIESARAGEAGRGFAVVADEVRALAQRTEESTAQIDDIINLVKNSSSGVVSVMSQINTQAQETLDIAQDAGKKLQQIFEEMELINEGNLMIASTTEEQSQMIQGIDSTLSSLQEESEAILGRVNQTSQSSDQLTALAQGLDDSVNEFKI